MIGQWLAWFVPQDERLELQQRLTQAGWFSTVFQLRGWVIAGAALPPPRKATQLAPELSEERGYLFSYCDDPSWAKIDAARVDRLLSDPVHLDQLPGDFSFARLRPDGVADVVRSCGGQGPWHFSSRDGRVAISTRLDWIAKSQRAAIELDELACVMAAMALQSALLPRSVLRGTQSLRAGHQAAVSAQKPNRITSYFRPAPLRLPPATEAHRRFVGERLRVLLFRCLDAELAADGNLVLYSGGLDSSLLVSIANKLGIKLHATSLLPPSDDPVYAREKRFTDLLSAGFLSHDRLITTPEVFDQLIGCEGLVVTGYFGGLPHRSLQSRGPLATALLGYRADELFGLFRAADWINATPLAGLPGLLRAQPRSFPLGLWWAQRQWSRRHAVPLATQLRPMFSPALRHEYREFYEREVQQSVHEPCGFRLSQILRYQDLSGSYAELAAVQGLRAVLPFVKREVVELAFATPPRELFHRRLAKDPLRSAARGLLPDSLIDRVDKGNWQKFPGRSLPAGASLSGTLEPFLDKSWLNQHPAIDAVAVRTLEYLQHLAAAKERLTHERDALFSR